MAVARDPTTGATLTSATVNVYNPGTVTPISATIFDKSNNPLSNPLTSDATTGLIDFYLSVAQEVDLVISKAAFTTRTYSNVPVIDDASFDLTALLTTTGDIAYASSANTPARLGIGGTGAFLTVASGVPSWSNNIAAGGLQVTAGNVGIGAGPQTNAGLFITGSILSGSNVQESITVAGTASSAATIESTGVSSQPATAAASFTCATVSGFHALNPTKGATSTITNAYGLLVDDITVGATINAGIQSQGDILPGSAAATGMVKGFTYIPMASGTPTGAPNNRASGTWAPLYYDSSAHKIWVYDNGAAGWKGVVVA